MKSNSILLFALLSCFLHCRETEEVQDLGYDYFPLKENAYWIYAVDSIVYNDFGSKADTFHYLEWNKVDTVFQDQSGKWCYRVLHHYRKDSFSPWKYYNTTCIQRNDHIAEQIYYNKRLVKLNFPIHLYKNWDVNSFNTEEEELAYITAVDFETTLSKVRYTDCILIEIADEEDLIFKYYETENYSRGIGLIERTLIDTETQDDKKKGISYHKTLLETNMGN